MTRRSTNTNSPDEKKSTIKDQANTRVTNAFKNISTVAIKTDSTFVSI